MNNKNLRQGGLYAALFFALCALIFFRFRDFFPSVFYGDDLAMFLYVHGAESNDPNIATLLNIIGNTKFRPVFTGFLTLETWLFAKHLGRYLIVNVLINAMTGVAAFAVFLNLSRNRLIAAVLASTLVTSRFALYQVTQVTGQVEGIPFLMFALMILFVHKAVISEDASTARRYEWLSLALWIAAFNSHERYIVIFPWLILCFLVYQRPVGIKHRLAFLGVMALAILSNVAIKVFVKKAPLFVGTGGHNMAVSPESIIELLRQAFLSIFGINTGPDYLIGYSWESLPEDAQWVAIGFSVLAAFMVLIALARAFWNDGVLRSFPLLLVLLAAAMIIPGSMTIRMEQRWELAPFFLLLCLVASASAASKYKWLSMAAVLGLCGTHAWIDQVISKGFPNIFFISEAAYARAVKDSIGTMPKGKDIILISEASHCDWGLLQSRALFDFYEGASRSAICVRDADAAREIADGRPVYASVSTTKIADVTSQIRDPYGPGIDLMSRLKDAQILNTAAEDTPTHTGVFDGHWDWVLGNQKTLVMLSGHGLTYKDVQTDGPAKLEIDAGMLFPIADNSEVVITVSPKDGSPREIVLKMPKLPFAERPNTSHFGIPVPELSRGPADISLALRTPSGNLAGAWAGFTSVYLAHTP